VYITRYKKEGEKMKNGVLFIGLVLVFMLTVGIAAVAADCGCSKQPEKKEVNDTEDTNSVEIRDSIERAITERDAKWTAGETSVSELSVEEKKRLCGVDIGFTPNGSARLSRSKFTYTGTFDWRDVRGQNWVTPVKNQGSCGSCWIFGATAAFETQINIDANDSALDFDASEQKILSCLSGGWGCNGGDPRSALKHIRDNGIPDEACMSYHANDDISCSSVCSDWESKAWTLKTIGIPETHTTDSYKAILENNGPMVVVLNVGEDLFYYRGGIYEPTWTSKEFGWANHCVMLVGYDDNNECWIIKNSWSTGWGEDGYGRVSYGQIEQYRYAFWIEDTSGYAPPPPVIDLEITDIWHEGARIYYTIKNNGTATVGSSYTSLTVDGIYKVRDSISSLGAGELRNESFIYTWSCTGTSDEIIVCADYEDAVAEVNETNNCKNETWNYEGGNSADLEITDIWHEEDRIYYTIKNNGTVNAGSSYTSLTIDGEYQCYDSVMPLEVGGERTERFLQRWNCSGRSKWACTGDGDEITVYTDYMNSVPESNETNNCRTEVWDCYDLDLPDLEITDIWHEGSKVCYKVKNIGETTVVSSNIALIIDGTYKMDDTIGPLEVGEEIEEFYQYKWICTGTSDVITVYADYEDAVLESDETNNYRTETWSLLKVNRIDKP
jgi:C1A family cysteine protease/archaellum component FlaF (FlaF/FlaG flagellin family)